MNGTATQGNVFLAMPPNASPESVILGRNSEDPNLVGVAQEVAYYEAHESVQGKVSATVLLCCVLSLNV